LYYFALGYINSRVSLILILEGNKNGIPKLWNTLITAWACCVFLRGHNCAHYRQ